jgi:hypothetical protein
MHVQMVEPMRELTPDSVLMATSRQLWLDSQGHLASILVWVNIQQAEHCDVGLPQEALCLKWELISLCSAAPVQPEVGRMKASP